MNVETILQTKGREVIAVKPGESVASAAETLHRRRIGAALVLGEDGEVAGVISERDIVRGLASHGGVVLGMKVAELMTSELETCEPGDAVDHIMAVMTERRVRHLPVMRNGKLVGVISIGDVVKHRLAEIESEAQRLREYIATG
jgi:CBS domain-containing protein